MDSGDITLNSALQLTGPKRDEETLAAYRMRVREAAASLYDLKRSVEELDEAVGVVGVIREVNYEESSTRYKISFEALSGDNRGEMEHIRTPRTDDASGEGAYLADRAKALIDHVACLHKRTEPMAANPQHKARWVVAITDRGRADSADGQQQAAEAAQGDQDDAASQNAGESPPEPDQDDGRETQPQDDDNGESAVTSIDDLLARARTELGMDREQVRDIADARGLFSKEAVADPVRLNQLWDECRQAANQQTAQPAA